MTLSVRPAMRPISTKLPSPLVIGVVIVCLLPSVLNFFGWDFGTPVPAIDLAQLAGESASHQSDQLHHLLAGSFTHTLLEWTAFCAAMFTAALAFSHFMMTGNVTTPVIGVALLCAGFLDAFHTLAADRLITAVADNQNLIPFTWALCRLCNVLLTLLGVGLFLLLKPKRWEGSSLFVLIASLGFGLMAYSVIYVSATQATLPNTMFPNAVISRPWDVAPLILFAIAGLIVYPYFYRCYPSLFSYALVVSAIPNVATQVHMAFGSTALFDNDFNIAHFLKILAYLVPLFGLLLDYMATYRQSIDANTQLQQTIVESQQAERALAESEAREREKSKELSQLLKELRQTQSQLIHTEKMSSLGQMVAGVAHEINNPVNFIYGNLIHAATYTDELLELIDLYQAEYPQPSATIQARVDELDLEFLTEDLQRLIASMRVGTDRIRQIVVSLRNFSRLDESDRKTVNIHEGLDSTLMLLHNQLKAKLDRPAIQVLTHYDDLPNVDCYPGQLNQVFMNILLNAIEAVRSADGLDKPTIKIQTSLVDYAWIKIDIQNNGPAIPAEVRSRIFDPFFTTKPVGQGTGLGLSVCYQIVHDHHRGLLSCSSDGVNGVTFSIQIPLRLQHDPKTQLQD